MNLDLKTRIVRLGLKQKDIVKMLERPGLVVSEAELSSAINRTRDYPKLGVLRNELAGLLTKLEHERGLD